jgi:hypothetical protein
MIRTAWHPGGHPRLLKNFDKCGFWIKSIGSGGNAMNTIKDFYNFSDTSTNTYTPTVSNGFVETLLLPNSSQSVSLSLSGTFNGNLNAANGAQIVSGYTFTHTQDGVI